MITEQRAQEFGIAPRGKDESMRAFRERVAGELRARGHIIEAHEALRDRLYDDDQSGAVMGGIMGAMAQKMQGREYSPGDGARQVGDDVAAGAFIEDDREDLPLEVLLLACLMSG